MKEREQESLQRSRNDSGLEEEHVFPPPQMKHFQRRSCILHSVAIIVEAVPEGTHVGDAETTVGKLAT